MKKNRGVISIFISLILVPIMVLSMLTVDIAKLEYARSIVENSNELALQSVLSRFDSNLKNVYGLFASNNTIEDDITKLVTLSVNGASDKSDAVNLNNIAVKNVAIKAVENTSLQNQDVLKFQILEYMKFRGLVSLTYGFLNKLKGFEGKDKEIEATQERVKAEDAFGKYKEKLLDLYKKFEKLAEKENEYLNAEKGQLYKSIVGAKSPSEIEKVIEDYLKDKYDIYFKKIPDFERKGKAKSAIPMGETQYTKSFPDLQKSLQKKDKKDKALQDLEDAKTRIRNLDYQYLNYHNNSVNAGSLKSYGKYPIDELIGLSTNLNPDSKDFLKNYSHFDDIIIGLTMVCKEDGSCKNDDSYKEIWEDYVSIFRAVDGDSRAHADVKTEIRNSFPELSDKYSQKYFSNFMKKYYELYENGTIDKKLRKELGEGYGEVKKALKAARDNIQKAIDTFSEIDNAIEEVKGAYEDAKAALEAWKAKAQQITDEEVKSQNMADIQLMENQLNEDYSLDRLKELMDLEKKYLEHIKKVLESVRLSGYETKFVSDGFKADDFSKELYKKKNYYDVIVEGEGKIEDLLKWLKEEVFKKLEALNKGDFKKEADKKEKDVLDDTDPEDSKLEIPKLPEVGDMGVPESPEGKPSDDGKKSALSALSNSIKFFADAGSLANLLENSANVLLLTEYGTEMFTNYLDREGADTENTKQKLLSGIEISKIASPYRGAEVEYIIFGGSSGQEAINSAANRIRLIRFGLNLVYSFTDSEITSFISAASAVAGPFAPALKIVLHALISYAETEIDINLLMEHGKSIPIFKSSKTWILKPTGAVSFLANTAKELTKKAINRTSTDIYNWMEKKADSASENLNKAVDKMKDDITGAIDNAIKTKIIQPILELVKDKSAAFKNGYIKTGEELTKAIEKEIDNICFAIDKVEFPGSDQYFNKEEIKSAIRDNGFVAELKAKIEEYSKMDLTKLVAEKMDEINKAIQFQISSITEKIANKINEEIEGFKNEILAEAKEGLDNLSEKSKKAISDKIDAFTNKLGSKSGGKSMSNAKKSILEFSYPEYLKLFMLLDYIGTVDGENDAKLARMYALMKDNLKDGEYKADIDNLSTVFRVDTQVDVETLILGKKAPSGNDLDIYMKNLTKSERTYNFTFSDVSGY